MAQLTPKSMRHIISFRWTCDFLGYPPSIEVFKEMHELARNQNAEHGWWAISNKRLRKGESQHITAFPYVSSVHNWKKQWLLVQVPVDPKHPHYYSPPKWFVRVDPEMSRVGPVDLGNPDHVALLEWFRAKTTREPMHWLPNFHYITREAILAAAGLSRIYDRGENSRAEIVLRRRCSPLSWLVCH